MIDLERNCLIWGVVGNLGGGKTLSAVALAVDSLRRGYYVISNVTLAIDKICLDFAIPWAKDLYLHIDLDNPDEDPYKWPCGDPRGSGGWKRVIVVLDECAEWFDQWTNAGKDPKVKRLLSWLRHSSKRSQDVVLVVQRQEYLNKSLRILIARWLWVDDLAVWRVPFLKLKLPLMGGLVMQNIFDRMGNKIGPVQFLSKSHWGSYYNTAECLNTEGAQYNTVYSLPPAKYNPPYILFLVWLLSLFLIYRAANGSRQPATVPALGTAPVTAHRITSFIYV